MLAFKQQGKGLGGLTGFSLEGLKKVFARGWEFESIKEFSAEVTPQDGAELPGMAGPGWVCWFAVIRKQ